MKTYAKKCVKNILQEMAGWLALKDVVKTIKSNPIYYCGSCTKCIDDETEKSI